jgi:hypothetical protein
MKTVTNNRARPHVLKCEEFNGAKNELSENGYAVSGRKVGHLYVVLSYGYWPMFVCDTRTDTWFINADRFGRTTTKQSGQCRPYGKECAPLPNEELDELLRVASISV